MLKIQEFLQRLDEKSQKEAFEDYYNKFMNTIEAKGYNPNEFKIDGVYKPRDDEAQKWRKKYFPSLSPYKDTETNRKNHIFYHHLQNGKWVPQQPKLAVSINDGKPLTNLERSENDKKSGRIENTRKNNIKGITWEEFKPNIDKRWLKKYDIKLNDNHPYEGFWRNDLKTPWEPLKGKNKGPNKIPRSKKHVIFIEKETEEERSVRVNSNSALPYKPTLEELAKTRATGKAEVLRRAIDAHKWREVKYFDYIIPKHANTGGGNSERDYLQYKCSKHEDRGYIKQRIQSHVELQVGCPYCRETAGEKIIVYEMQNKGFSFNEDSSKYITTQKKFNNLVYETGKKASIDLYGELNNIKFMIEYHGKQHYESIEFFKSFIEKQQERDQMRRDYAEKNNMHYLEIGYKSRKNIKSIIDKFLKDIQKNKERIHRHIN